MQTQNKHNISTMCFATLLAAITGSMFVAAHPLSTTSAAVPQSTYMASIHADRVVDNTLRLEQLVTGSQHTTAVAPPMPSYTKHAAPSGLNNTVRFNATMDCYKILAKLGLDNAVNLNTTKECNKILAKLGLDNLVPYNMTKGVHPQCWKCKSCMAKPAQLNRREAQIMSRA
jgi:hypothetical protein